MYDVRILPETSRGAILSVPEIELKSIELWESNLLD